MFRVFLYNSVDGYPKVLSGCVQYVKYFTSFQFIEKLGSGKYKLYSKNGTSEEYDFLIWAGHPFDLPNVIYLGVSTTVPVRGTRDLNRVPSLKSFINIFFRLFPIISISQKFFSFFFLTLEKIGIDEKVICYHNISN